MGDDAAGGMTSVERQPGTSRAIGVVAHDLGHLLALYGSEAECTAFAAIDVVRRAGVDEATFNSAKLRIEDHLGRLREQRREIAKLMDGLSLLDQSRAGTVELDIQTVSAKELLALAARDRDDLRMSVVGMAAEDAVTCDLNYTTTALRYMLEVSRMRPPSSSRSLEGVVVVEVSRQLSSVVMAAALPSRLDPHGGDTRTDLARLVVEMHGGILSLGPTGCWTLSLPTDLPSGRLHVQRPCGRTNQR